MKQHPETVMVLKLPKCCLQVIKNKFIVLFTCIIIFRTSSITIIFGPPANIRYGLTVLIHNSGQLGWAPFTVLPPPSIAGAADG